MMNITPIASLELIAAEEKQKRKEVEKAEKKEAALGPANGVDPILLAFLLLLEASTTTSHSALIHAKELQQNALSQQRLNQQAAQLKWYDIPKEQNIRHSFISWGKAHWTIHWFKHHAFEYWSYKIRVWYSHPNAAIVNRYQNKDQEVSAERQVLADRLTTMQQEAQISETNVNTITNEAMQTTQEGSNLLDMLKTLTFHAMLRHPVQG